MADKKVNIDVVFRNGLKDYEAIPPNDVWEDIKPFVPSSNSFPVFAKIAASLAIMMVLAYFSYKLGINSAIRLSDNGLTPPSELIITPPQTQPPVILADGGITKIAEIENNKPIQDIIISGSKTDKNEIVYSQILAEVVVPDKFDLYEPDNLWEETSSSKNYTIEEYNSMGAVTKNSNRREDVEQKWTVAALASPNYYSGAIDGGSAVILSADENPSISYSGGVAFSYKISQRVSIQSGLYYSNVGQRINGISSYAGFGPHNTAKSGAPFEVATANGTIHSNNTDIFLADVSGNRINSDYSIDNFDPMKSNLPLIGTSLEQSFKYLEVPISLRYKIVDGVLGVNLVGGLSSNLLVGNNVYSKNDGSIHYIGKTDGMRGFIISSTVGMGVEYNISNSFSLNLEPMLRYYLTPINTSSIGSSPFTFGLFSGIAYKF